VHPVNPVQILFLPGAFRACGPMPFLVPAAGWKRGEKCQGNDCQGNISENAFSHSLDNHSPDFGFFPQNNGSGILPEMRDGDILPCQPCGPGEDGGVEKGIFAKRTQFEERRKWLTMRHL
jgi:hypothetical protein